MIEHGNIEIATGPLVGVEIVTVPANTAANPTTIDQRHYLHDWVAVDPVDLANGRQPCTSRVVGNDPPTAYGVGGLVSREVHAPESADMLRSIDASLKVLAVGVALIVNHLGAGVLDTSARREV
jgi:hypothetical protein